MKAGSSILAPMVDISDHPGFLYSCKKRGCDAIVLPMMFLEGIAANPAYIEKRLHVLFQNDRNFDFRPIIVQLIGNDIESVKHVIDVLGSYDVQGINLNMGCPSGRVKALGLGASILDRPAERDALIDAVLKHSPLPVSVKIRLFGKETADVASTIRFCQLMQERDLDWICVHGRTGRQGYKGRANWDAIKMIREATDLFIVGNGDVKSWSDGRARVDAGYCDAFMIGRAAMKDPRVLQHDHDMTAGKTMNDARQLYEEIMEFMVANKDRGIAELLAPHEIRKWALYLSFNMVGGKRLREPITRKTTVEDVSALFRKP